MPRRVDSSPEPDHEPPELTPELLRSVENPQARKVLRALQQQRDELEDENLEHRRTLKALEREVEELKKTGRKRRKNGRGARRVRQRRNCDSDEDNDSDKENAGTDSLVLAARKAFLMVSPFIDPATTDLLLEELEEDDERIPKVLEYIETIPASLQERSREAEVVNTYLYEYGAIRSTFVHRLRRDCPLDVFGPVYAQEMADSKRANSVALKELLGFNTQTKTYKRAAPILYGDQGEDAHLTKGVFRNPILPRACRALLFGKASLDGSVVRGKKRYGHLFRATEMTPVLFATTTILCAYSVSADTEFRTKGNRTNIKYFKLYEYYLRLANLMFKTAAGSETIRRWNKAVFQGTAFTVHDDDEGDESDEDVEEMLAREVEEEEAEAELRDQTDPRGSMGGSERDPPLSTLPSS